MRISDWSSDVCSSDLEGHGRGRAEDAQHVVPAPRGAQIDDQQAGTGCRARGGHCPGGAAHAAIGCAVDALADVGKGLGGTGEPGQKDIATHRPVPGAWLRSEEHTSELQSLMRTSYAVFCLK